MVNWSILSVFRNKTNRIKKQEINMKNPILWQTQEVNHNGDPFFTARKAKGYYIYGERAGVDSVAFILIDNEKGRSIGLINEPKPPLGDDVFLTTAFGGSLDKNLPLERIVQEEVAEESGYIVPLKRIHYLEKVFVSTQMNQFCHLYAVDVTGLIPGARHLDENEFGSTVQWLGPEQLLKIQDWKAPLIYMKYLNKD